MDAFQLLKNDLIVIGIIQGKYSTKWNQYARASVWIFVMVLSILSYLFCGLFEAETLNERTDAFFFGFGNTMLLISTFFLIYQTNSVTKLLADLESIVNDRQCAVFSILIFYLNFRF